MFPGMPRGGIGSLVPRRGIFGIGTWSFKGFKITAPSLLGLGMSSFTFLGGEELAYGTGANRPKVRMSKRSRGLVRLR